MKRFFSSAAILATLIIAVCINTDFSFAQKGNEKSKGDNGQVKLFSNAVEIVEIKPVGEKCEKGGTTLRLRVTSESPVDVKLFFQTKRGTWAASDYLNKKKGDEITYVECQEKAKFKVHTRAAGSDKWPTL